MTLNSDGKSRAEIAGPSTDRMSLLQVLVHNIKTGMPDAPWDVVSNNVAALGLTATPEECSAAWEMCKNRTADQMRHMRVLFLKSVYAAIEYAMSRPEDDPYVQNLAASLLLVDIKTPSPPAKSLPNAAAPGLPSAAAVTNTGPAPLLQPGAQGSAADVVMNEPSSKTTNRRITRSSAIERLMKRVVHSRQAGSSADEPDTSAANLSVTVQDDVVMQDASTLLTAASPAASLAAQTPTPTPTPSSTASTGRPFPAKPASTRGSKGKEREVSVAAEEPQDVSMLPQLFASVCAIPQMGMFRSRVTEDVAPGYRDYVRQPLCLLDVAGRIPGNLPPLAELKLEEDEFVAAPAGSAYKSVAEMWRDLLLMFSHAFVYNAPDSQYYRSATACLHASSALVKPHLSPSLQDVQCVPCAPLPKTRKLI